MSGRPIVGIVLLLMISATLHAGGENNGRGAKAVSLANSFVAIADNPWALYYNPAGLSDLKSIQGSVFFIPQQFALTELKTVSFVAAVPTSLGTVAAGVSQFGFDLYQESEFSLGIGGSIEGAVSGGLAFRLDRISIEQYGSAQTVATDVGILVRLNDEANVGFSYKNLFGAAIGSQRDRLPQLFSFGVRYSPIPEFFLTSEIEKDIRFPLVIKVAAEQRFMGVVSFRLGVSNNPDKFSAGIALQYSPFEFAYAGYSHPQLGWTHQIELSIILDQRQ